LHICPFAVLYTWNFCCTILSTFFEDPTLLRSWKIPLIMSSNISNTTGNTQNTTGTSFPIPSPDLATTARPSWAKCKSPYNLQVYHDPAQPHCYVCDEANPAFANNAMPNGGSASQQQGTPVPSPNITAPQSQPQSQAAAQGIPNTVQMPPPTYITPPGASQQNYTPGQQLAPHNPFQQNVGVVQPNDPLFVQQNPLQGQQIVAFNSQQQHQQQNFPQQNLQPPGGFNGQPTFYTQQPGYGNQNQSYDRLQTIQQPHGSMGYPGQNAVNLSNAREAQRLSQNLPNNAGGSLMSMQRQMGGNTQRNSQKSQLGSVVATNMTVHLATRNFSYSTILEEDNREKSYMKVKEVGKCS
jgi:hypothetical protein